MKKEEKTITPEVRTSKNEKLFTLVKDGQNKIRIAVGQYLVSQKKFDEYKQAEAYIATKPYELIINTTILLIKFNNEKENKNENQKDA